MRSFEQLRATDALHEQGENSLGTVYWRREGGPAGTTVQRFETAGAPAVAAYVSLHAAARQWVHDDDEHDAWYIFDVDEPLEVGTDFVIVRRRVGNSLASFLSYDDPAPPPPRVAELRALMPELLAAAATPTERWIARLVADRIARPSHDIIFDHDESLFRIQDLAPTRDELEDWARISTAAPRPASAGSLPRAAPHPRWTPRHRATVVMRALAELRATDTLHDQGENSLGTVAWRREGGPLGTTVQGFEYAGAAAVEAFVSLHEAAHLWVHEDFEYDAWHVLDVDEPLEVGTDFVILRRRAGSSLASLESLAAPAPAPPRLAELRELVSKLHAAATSPTDRWIADLVARRVARADHRILYDQAENRFWIQGLGPTRDDLEAWTRVRLAARASARARSRGTRPP